MEEIRSAIYEGNLDNYGEVIAACTLLFNTGSLASVLKQLKCAAGIQSSAETHGLREVSEGLCIYQIGLSCSVTLAMWHCY